MRTKRIFSCGTIWAWSFSCSPDCITFSYSRPKREEMRLWNSVCCVKQWVDSSSWTKASTKLEKDKAMKTVWQTALHQTSKLFTYVLLRRAQRCKSVKWISKWPSRFIDDGFFCSYFQIPWNTWTNFEWSYATAAESSFVISVQRITRTAAIKSSSAGDSTESIGV